MIREESSEMQVNSFDCYLLALSEKHTRLFKCHGNTLKEIVDNNFPRQFVDDHEYQKCYRASSTSYSLKGEKEKSTIHKERLRQFLRAVDNTIDRYVSDTEFLFIGGVERNLVSYMEVTKHNGNMIGMIKGNLDYCDRKQLNGLLNLQKQKYISENYSALFKRMRRRREQLKLIGNR